MSVTAPPLTEKPTNVRYGVLGFACALSMITYFDRACWGRVVPEVQKEFGLTDEQIGWIPFAFLLAYSLFEIPSGWLGDVFGPRKTLIRIVLWWSVFTILTGCIYPTTNPEWLWVPFALIMAVQFLFGMGEAGAYPNIARSFHNWFPSTGRGFAKGAVWMAGRFGAGIAGFIVYALFYKANVGGREVLQWRHVFWIFGSLGFIWCFFFYAWFRDRPDQKKGVNAAEITLIQHGEDHSTARVSVPWRHLLLSPNLWYLCVMYFCCSYGWYFNLNYLPKFLKDHYHMDPGETFSPGWWYFSLLTGLPLLAGSVACLTGGVLSDYFIRRTGNRKWGRRFFGILGHSMCALSYLAALVVYRYFPGNAGYVVTCIAMAAFWNDMTMGAAWASCLDVGKRFSGVVSGFMNTIGNLGGAVSSVITGYILGFILRQYNSEDMGWAVNFATYGGVYVIATIMWMLFDATKPLVPVQVSEPPPDFIDPMPDGIPAPII